MDKTLVWKKAREYVGSPFHQQGRIKGKGIDCVGIVLCVGQDLGLHYRDGRPIGAFDYMDYGLFPVLDEMQREAQRIFVAKPGGLADLEAGDILTLRAPFLVHHMAIVSELEGGLGIIHSLAYRVRGHANGKVVEHLLDRVWKSRVAGVFSYADL